MTKQERNAEILELVAQKKITPAEAAERLAAPMPKGELYCKVSQKGCVSVYGLQRMPVTLYAEQWYKLLGVATTGYAQFITEFIHENLEDLAWKHPEVKAMFVKEYKSLAVAA